MGEKVIRSLQNERIKELVKLRKSSSSRKMERQVLIAGRKMVKECSLLCPPSLILAQEGHSLPPYKGETERLIVTEEVLKKITGLTAPDRVAATFPIPQKALPTDATRLLILDRVQDPGNLGTLIRTADAFSWDGLYLIEGCADPCNDKALRAAKGSTFRIPWTIGTKRECLEWVGKRGLTLLAADLEGANLETLKAPSPFALILGSEGEGIDQELLEQSKRVTLPIRAGVDSLNVAIAGGIALFLLKKGGEDV
jgi:RNA methyltransferase, TrmH family